MNRDCEGRYFTRLIPQNSDLACEACGMVMTEFDFQFPISTEEQKKKISPSLTLPPSWDGGGVAVGRHECSVDCPRDHDAEWKDEQVMKKKF